MKKTFSLFILLIQAAFVMAQFPLPFQKKVKAMPEAFERPSAATKTNDHGGTINTPWIVFSDRDENYTTTTPGGSLFMKKLNLMEPFYVAQEKKGYLKLIKYSAGILNGRKINDKKSAVSYGWISRSKVLLWNRSYVNQQTGFPEKSIAIISGALPLTVPSSYYDLTDSVYVYSSPELKKAVTKVRLHEINYIFKKSEDGSNYLIGNEDQLVADSARKVIYGWVAADAVHNWGQRLYISPLKFDSDELADSTAMVLNHEHGDPLLGKNDVILRSSPVIGKSPSADYVLGRATDVYDKSENTLITIDGSDLKYPDYLDLRKNIHKVNVVFVIDGSSAMKKYFPGLTNTVQSFENIFNEYDKKHQLSYGAVVYRDNENCAARGISSTELIYPDYRKLMSFLSSEAIKTRECNNKVSAQPLYDGVRTALNLFHTHHNETNLVVLIGSVGDSTLHFRALSEEFGRQNARLLTMQMYSDYNEWYNNFVLNAKRLVSESAVVSAEKKKGFLVNGEGLNDKQTYNTTHLDSISFYLDYPANSLIQGGVVFPTKGSVNSNKYMTAAIKRFMKETDFDINNQINSLDSAFRLRGIIHENLSEVVKGQLPNPIGEDVADRMPHNGFKYYLNNTVPANIITGHQDLLQYSIVLNSAEYKQFNDIVAVLAGENLEQDAPSFRKQLFKNYLKIPKESLELRVSSGTVKSMTLANYFKTVTGIPLTYPLLDKYTVRDLKNESHMPKADFEKYIRFMISSGNHIKTEGRLNQHMISNGKTYYYVTQQNFTVNPEK